MNTRYNRCVNLKCRPFLTKHVFRRDIVRMQRNGSVGICTIRSTRRRYEGEERRTRWLKTEVFACLLTKNPANALDTDRHGRVYSWSLHCATMVEINVERENPRLHNPRSRNPIVSTVCAAYQSALACDIGFHSKLCISPLSRFLSTCAPFAPAPTAKSAIHNSDICEIQTCALSIHVTQFTILYYSCFRCSSHTLFLALVLVSLRYLAMQPR